MKNSHQLETPKLKMRVRKPYVNSNHLTPKDTHKRKLAKKTVKGIRSQRTFLPRETMLRVKRQ